MTEIGLAGLSRYLLRDSSFPSSALLRSAAMATEAGCIAKADGFARGWSSYPAPDVSLSRGAAIPVRISTAQDEWTKSIELSVASAAVDIIMNGCAGRLAQ